MTGYQQEWLEVLAGLKDRREPCAQVLVIGVRGSAPREVGARMVVAGGKLVWGTIGGGRLEHLAIERARDLCAEGTARSYTEAFPLSEKAGQCCGGEVVLHFEGFPWSRRRLVIFGAGHVAQAVAGLHGYMGLDVLLVDPRSEDELEPPLPAERGYEVLFIDAPEEEVDAVPADSYLLVMTHDHSLDQEIVARALRRGSFPYVGLIGSERKWTRFRSRLAQRGFGEEQLRRITCPIGVVKGSKEPRAIALSVATEIVEHLARVSP